MNGGLITVTLAFCLIGALACHERKESASFEGDEPPVESSADRIETDKEVIFQRAFWTRPSEGDEILHAERREWLEEEKVEQWEWYLAVRPSAELRSSLFEKNRFRLKSSSFSAISFQQAPRWFSVSKDAQVLAADDESMVLAWSPNENILFGRGHGGGFSGGASTPLKTGQNPSRETPRRLPNHSP